MSSSALLADQWLPEALRAQARKVPVPVEVEANGIGRYPQEDEAAVYFCVLTPDGLLVSTVGERCHGAPWLKSPG